MLLLIFNDLLFFQIKNIISNYKKIQIGQQIPPPIYAN